MIAAVTPDLLSAIAAAGGAALVAGLNEMRARSRAEAARAEREQHTDRIVSEVQKASDCPPEE